MSAEAGHAQVGPPRRVAILAHPGEREDGAIEAAVRIAAERGSELRVCEREPEQPRAEVAGVPVTGELPGDVDLCVALGGDGTILRALRRYAGSGVPVFGINYGTVGFLAAAEAHAVEDGLRRALTADFETIELPALELSGATDPQIAINDVSFTRRPHQRVAELSYSVGGREVGRVRCDGLVAATPVGSTGYNLANNGPILAWGVEGYVVSFVAPHTLTARSLVVAPDDVLHVTNVGTRDPVDLAVDGIGVGELGPGEEVSIGFRDARTCLAQLEGETFYGRIREKFGRLAH